MVKSQRPFWNYPLFQIPLMFFGAFLVAAALFWLLGIGRPQVAVAIALDLSNSTHEGRFNAPGTVMYQEVQAVQAYLDKNGDILRQPNAIKVLGFGGVVVPLTNEFNTNSGQVKKELTTALNNPNLAQQVVPETTNITDAIDKG
ncbi:MAG: VWA domain-containing protein, partial [Chroococcales cyanobacterium]